MTTVIWNAGKVYHRFGDLPCEECQGHGWVLQTGYPVCPTCNGACYYSKREIRVVFDKNMLARNPIGKSVCKIGDVWGNVLQKARPSHALA